MRRQVEEDDNEGTSFKINIPNRHNAMDWRFIFGNSNTLGDYSNNYNAMKWDKFKYLNDGMQLDIIGLIEHNRVIMRMARENRPQEVIGKWQPRTVTCFSWLRSENNTTSYNVHFGCY